MQGGSLPPASSPLASAPRSYVVGMTSLGEATSAFGSAAKVKLGAAAVTGQPEEQLRSPVESYLKALAELGGSPPGSVVLVGESAVTALQVRPDFAVLTEHVLTGFVELKAPGKGADPRRFTDAHDRSQWQKLQALPNLLYTDGNEFSLWRSGELGMPLVRLTGDVAAAGKSLVAPPTLVDLVAEFLSWSPVPPTSPDQLAQVSARLCRLLRDEVAEQMALGNPTLAGLATDWRQLLFPQATDAQFADSYAQAVTFGLLMARVKGIDLTNGVGTAASRLATQQHSLIGTALRILTDGQLAEDALATSVATLVRTLSVVDWAVLSGGHPDAWLYFYEGFLTVYDPRLRKLTGSYYTPVPVVTAMTRLVDEALTSRFALPAGLAEQSVTVLDPALGTGTFLLEVLRRVAARVTEQQGGGAVPVALAAAVRRVIGFELQIGPFAVAQLRLLAELTEFAVPAAAQRELRTYVTDTLADPLVEEAKLGTWYEPIAASRRAANKVKADEPVMVVLGNPPYKEKSRGLGGFVESGAPGRPAPMRDFMPHPDLGVGAHVKHLYNPYVYFWRWATEKVFDQHAAADRGVVCFITVAGFLGGPGFAQMRSYLRSRADAIYVIDCTPEGHQPPVASRIFQAVQQPVCIVLAVRDGSTAADTPAPVLCRQLATGTREAKFAELAGVALSGPGWVEAPDGWTAPFRAGGTVGWTSYPGIDDLFLYGGSGTMAGRTWPIAPDRESLADRWDALVGAPAAMKEELLQPHNRDRRLDTVLSDNLAGYEATSTPIGAEDGPLPEPVRYGYRSLDRQWIIPDKRLINQPNPFLWKVRGPAQVYLTGPHVQPLRAGAAVTASALVPDLDYYNNRGGQAWPMWLDPSGTIPNVPPLLLGTLPDRLGVTVDAPALMAYVAGVLAHPGYAQRFSSELATPGLRVPLTADRALFEEAVGLGRTVLRLHTYGTRYVDAAAGRPAGSPGLPEGTGPAVLSGHPFTADGALPENLAYDPSTETLKVGEAWISPVPTAVNAYSVGGKNVLRQWFSYRKLDRTRPTIGSRRNSPLSRLQPSRGPPRTPTTSWTC